jgi:hypothetical protein
VTAHGIVTLFDCVIHRNEHRRPRNVRTRRCRDDMVRNPGSKTDSIRLLCKYD